MGKKGRADGRISTRRQGTRKKGRMSTRKKGHAEEGAQGRDRSVGTRIQLDWVPRLSRVENCPESKTVWITLLKGAANVLVEKVVPRRPLVSGHGQVMRRHFVRLHMERNARGVNAHNKQSSVPNPTPTPIPPQRPQPRSHPNPEPRRAPHVRAC